MADEHSAPQSTPDTESLVKRLAGPSTTKAGLAKDQTDINRIIAEVSKGSKFYENEKRKDKDLTERISRILKQRDEALKGVDLHKVEEEVDKLLVKLEAERDLTQTIVHVDMDAFYANVELLDNPKLAGKPFGVGRGVLTTASYEARKFGVRSGMAGFVAKKLCPELIFVDMHFNRYSEISKQVMEIFRRYDPNMCPAGCDEGYLNITEYCREHELSPGECVQQMRRVVHEETQLTVSAGIAPNKMLAKICSDKNKPNGQFELAFEAEAIKEFMRDLSIRKVQGVGRVNERLLDSIGIKNCGDIYTHRATLWLMDKHFGLHFLLQAYLGIGSNVVRPYLREERKSIGAERTFNPLSDKDAILNKLDEVAAELEGDMESNGWTGKTVTLKFKLDTYQVFTRARSFDKWISTKKEDLYAIGKELLMPELPLSLRLIGLRVTKLKDLRADPDANSGGIKRFFESATINSSPRKRRRDEVDKEEHGLPRLGSQYEDAMPGFHENAELEEEGLVILDIPFQNGNTSLSEGAAGSSKRYNFETSDHQQSGMVTASKHASKCPISAPVPSIKPDVLASNPTSNKLLKSKPRSALSDARRVSKETKRNSSGTSAHNSRAPAANTDPIIAKELQTCPICDKTMETDNRGLNAHIDFCLSKGAIMEAQTSASAPARAHHTLRVASPHRSPSKGGRKRKK